MDKKDPKRGDNQVALSNLSICYTWNNIKSCTDVINLKYLDQNGVLILNCLMNLTPYQTFRTNLNPPSRSMKHWLIDHQLKYINRTQNRVTIKIEFGNYNEFLTPETIKLGSIEQKINKDKNGKNVPPLKIIEVVLVHCNIVNNYTSMNQEFRLRLFKQVIGPATMSPTNHTYSEILCSKFSHIEVCFTDQNFKPQEIEDMIGVYNEIFNWS